MKVRALLLGVLALLLVSSAGVCRAGGRQVDGLFDTPMGPVKVGFNFKADGAMLPDSTTGPDGAELPIKNGKIDGDKISFTVDRRLRRDGPHSRVTRASSRPIRLS